MNWKLAIERNHAALAAVIATLAGMIVPDAAKLSRPMCRDILLILRPAEAALRRLIVIVAALLKERSAGKPAKRTGRPLPDFACFHTGRAIPAFPLIDPRRTFVPDTRWSGTGHMLPRISVPGISGQRPAVKPDATFDAAAIARRIAALDHALNSLPLQARRLLRLMQRRGKAKPGPGRTGPIRPGLPPGHRTRHRHPVDEILRECHLLARDSLARHCAFRVPFPPP